MTRNKTPKMNPKNPKLKTTKDKYIIHNTADETSRHKKNIRLALARDQNVPHMRIVAT